MTRASHQAIAAAVVLVRLAADPARGEAGIQTPYPVMTLAVTLLVTLTSVLMAALLPDFDLYLLRRARRWPMPARRLSAHLGRHRGGNLHAIPIVGALVIVPLYLGAAWLELAQPIGVTCAAAIAAHLLADCCTPAGCALLAPLYGRRLHLLPRRWRIHRESQPEQAVRLAALLTALFAGSFAFFETLPAEVLCRCCDMVTLLLR